MISLCFTSFLFSTTVMHAYYTRNLYYHHLMLAVTVLSIAFHHSAATGVEQVYFKNLGLIDKITAHAVFCLLSWDITEMIYNNYYTVWLLIFPYTIAMIWFLELSPVYKHLNQPLHTILHLVSICSVHWLIYMKSNGY
jgi:hypothetical protein